MMLKEKLFITLLILQAAGVVYASDMSGVLSTVKGIGSSFKSMGEHIGDVFKVFGEDIGHGKIGQAFSSLVKAPPGYTYTYKVFNDTDQAVYIKVQDYGSFMGGIFPIGGGPTVDTIGSFGIYPQKMSDSSTKNYYFQMSISGSPSTPSDRMPYSDTDALFLQDCTHLPQEKNSSKTNYFRTFIGKSLSGGHYMHGLRAEYVGYSDPSSKKDKGISLGTALSSLVIYNNTADDILIGYCSDRSKQVTKQNCDVIALVEKHSFALLNATTEKPLNSGKLGLFTLGSNSIGALFAASQNDQSASSTYTFPKNIFSGKTYTLEIYQDQGQGSKQMGLQGVMPGHYDMPTGRVRNITPIQMVVWHKSVAQLDDKTLKNNGMRKADYNDLPGQLWMVSKGDHDIMTSQIELGTATKIIMLRPTLVEGERWYYFLYVDTTDVQKAKDFVTKFINGTIGNNIKQAYHTQAETQVQNAIDLQHEATKVTGSNSSDQIPEKILIEAIQGSLDVEQGLLKDTSSGLTGYLLGADVFLPSGAGSQSTYYYQLAPSSKISGLKQPIPTSAIQSQYAYTLDGKNPPKGMPAISASHTFNFAK